MEKWQPLIDYLTTFMREELARQDHNATGDLSRSLRVEVKDNITTTTITGYGNSYGFFVNDGRRAGTMPPPSFILSWMRTRGIGADLQKEYQKRGLAYVIARSIAEKGVPPMDGYSAYYAQGNAIDRTGFVDKIFTEHGDEVERIIMQIVGADFDKTNEVFWKHIKGQE